MMTEVKYRKLVSRIFWFSLPLIISLLTFLVVNIFTIKESVTKESTRTEASSQLQEKMWVMIQENNKILNTKADEQENKKDHQFLMEQLVTLNNKVDHIKNRSLTTQAVKFDTVINCGAEILAVSKSSSNKLDTIKNLLEKNKENYTFAPADNSIFFTDGLWKNLVINKTK